MQLVHYLSRLSGTRQDLGNNNKLWALPALSEWSHVLGKAPFIIYMSAGVCIKIWPGAKHAECDEISCCEDTWNCKAMHFTCVASVSVPEEKKKEKKILGSFSSFSQSSFQLCCSAPRYGIAAQHNLTTNCQGRNGWLQSVAQTSHFRGARLRFYIQMTGSAAELRVVVNCAVVLLQMKAITIKHKKKNC